MALPFNYEPLDERKGEIRILQLHVGSSPSPIEISIRHVQLTAEVVPTYEALSYTWGSPDNPMSINIRKDGVKVLSVTHNLALPCHTFALRRRVGCYGLMQFA
jgi:hypothetical protein